MRPISIDGFVSGRSLKSKQMCPLAQGFLRSSQRVKNPLKVLQQHRKHLEWLIDPDLHAVLTQFTSQISRNSKRRRRYRVERTLLH